MRTGASCVCQIGNMTAECNSAEIRYVKNEEAKFKADLKFAREHNIFAICNIDGWIPSGGHLRLDINRLTDMMTIMYELGCNKTNSTIAVDNEPMKYMSREDYCEDVNKAYNFIDGRFLVGAGCEEFGLAGARGLYPYIFMYANFDIFYIHIQASMINPDTWRVKFETLRHYLELSREYCNRYGKILSCNEANWSKIKTSEGHSDLMAERDIARDYGCTDFCIVFINGHDSIYSWLSYLWHGEKNSRYWDDLRQRMLEEKKTIEEEKMEYLRPDELQAVYDAFNLKTPYHYKTPNLFVVGEKDPSKPFTWADADAMEETRMKALISGLKILNVLPSDFPDYPNIKYNSDGSWNGKWLEYAKSKPKEGL
jgi:hypothetical protein